MDQKIKSREEQEKEDRWIPEAALTFTCDKKAGEVLEEMQLLL